MSFFDDDEPIRASRTRPARPRTPAPAGGRAGGGGGGGARRPPGGGVRRGPDPATARQRQLILGGGSLVIFIILVFLISSCQSSRKEQALKDYNREVTALGARSNRLGVEFFAALNSASSGANVTLRITRCGVVSDGIVKDTNALKPRGELVRAQGALELAMNFRAEALRKIADKLPAALVQGRDNAQSVEKALTAIAGQMRLFDASDTIYSQRVTPYITQALADDDIDGQDVPPSVFMRNLGWLDKSQIAGRLGSVRAGGGRGASTAPAPGLHGHSLTSVSVGSRTLQPGSNNTISARPAPVFTVKLANGGDNNESDVKVTARITGLSGRSIPPRTRTITQTRAKSDASVSIPLGVVPATGAATLTVTIAKVPGEQSTDNNKQSYTVVFQG